MKKRQLSIIKKLFINLLVETAVSSIGIKNVVSPSGNKNVSYFQTCQYFNDHENNSGYNNYFVSGSFRI